MVGGGGVACFRKNIFDRISESFTSHVLKSKLFSGFSEVSDVSTSFRQKDQEDNVLCLLQEDSHKH